MRVLSVIEPRKNHKLLLEAYDKGLKVMGYNIIMAGYMGWNMENLAKHLKENPDYNKRIFHFDGLGDREIDYLYQHARFLAFCSYTEGLGLPLIEAIMRGALVITADIPMSREVAGDYFVWFEQDNVEALCDSVKKYTDNEEEYLEWKKRLNKYEAVGWEKVCEEVREYI